MDMNCNTTGAHSPNHWDFVFCSAGGVGIANVYPKCHVQKSCG